MTGDRTLPSPVLVTVATAKQVQMKEHYLVASWRTGSSLPTEVDPAGNGGSGAATLAPFPGKNGGGGGGRSGESRRRTGDRVPPARDDPTEQVDRTGYRNRNRRGRGAMNSHHGSPLPQEGRVVNNAFAHINRSQHPVEYARAVSSPDMWASNMHEPHSAYYPNYVSNVYPDDGSTYSNMMNGNEFGAIPYSSGYGNSFEGNNMTGGGVRGPRRRRRGGGGGTVPKRETSGGDLASNFREGRARGKQPDTTIHGVHVKAHGDSNHIQAQCKEFAEMAGIQMREIVQLPSHLQERQSQASSNNIEEVLSVVISSPSDISRSHTPVLGPDDTADGVPLAKPVIPQSFQPQPTPEVSSSLVCEDRLPKIDLLIIVGTATDATQLSDVLRQKPSHPNAPYTVHILNNHGDRSGHHASPSPTLILKNIPRTSTCELLTEELSRLPWKPLSVQFQGNPRGPFHGVAIAVYPSTGEAERVKLVLDHFSIGEPKKILRVSFGYKDKKNQDSQLINPASASNKTTAPNSIVHEELDLDDNEPEPSEEVRAHFDVHLLGLKQSSSEELSMRYLRSSLTLPELKYLRTAAGKLGLRFELSAEHASIICVSGAEGGPLKQNASADLTKNLSYRGSSHWKQVGQRNVEQFLPIESTIGPNDIPPPKPFGAGRGKPI